MDGKTMDEVRKALLERWNQLRRIEGDDGATSAASKELSATPTEIIDIAQNLEQIDRDLSLAEQGRKELVAIERALAKMATAHFGICEDCGEEIPVKRLSVVPEARLCANCQAVEERQSARTRYTSAAR